MPEFFHHDTPPNTLFDVIVVGAGVVGCAVARRFTLEGANVLLIEKSSDPLDGASKGNSAILHTGFDAPPPESQEHGCIVAGYHEYLEIRAQLNLPLLACGALVLAWSEAEAAQLDKLRQHAHHNGIDNTSIISASQVLCREPQLDNSVCAAIAVPGESLIDPWSAPHAYLLQALENGAGLMRDCALLGGTFDGGAWTLETSRGSLRGRQVINCAGLYGDHVNRLLMGEAPFTIRPRKGQFVVFDKSARALTQSILLPVPNKVTKGVVVCPTMFGNLLVGPTAEEQSSRDDASVDTAALKQLIATGQSILPALREQAVTAVYAGIRPATEFKDYQIQWHHQHQYCCVGGIRSTGLSAALGIARLVFRQYAASGAQHTPPASIRWPRLPTLAEHEQRDWQQAGNQGIVCHCEQVTRREIQRALDGPMPPRSLAGLKRRTRATMGRCQGFYCTAALSELTDGRFTQALSERMAKT